MYDQLHALEVINRERQKELNKIPHYRFGRAVKIKAKGKKPVICNLPIVSKLTPCQCQ